MLSSFCLAECSSISEHFACSLVTLLLFWTPVLTDLSLGKDKYPSCVPCAHSCIAVLYQVYICLHCQCQDVQGDQDQKIPKLSGNKLNSIRITALLWTTILLLPPPELLTWKFMYVGNDIVCILALRDFILTLGLVVFVFWVRSSFFGLGCLHFWVRSS